MTDCDHDLSLVARAYWMASWMRSTPPRSKRESPSAPPAPQSSTAFLVCAAALRAEGVRVAAPERLRRRLAETLAAAEAPPTATVVSLPSRRARPLAWMGGGAGRVDCRFGRALRHRPERTPAGRARPAIWSASHVRSLQVAHLVDVETSDQHVVKPWFNGKLDFAPPVVDLKDQGFPLVGGRLDVIRRRTRGGDRLSARPARDQPVRLAGCAARTARAEAQTDGYTLRHWRAGGLTFWAVSDVNPNDLALFEADLKART